MLLNMEINELKCKKYFILDKDIFLKDSFDIYKRRGVKYYITRTIFNQLKNEYGYKKIKKIMNRNYVSIIGYIHDIIDDNYSITDLNCIDKKYFLYVISNNKLIEPFNNMNIDYCHIQYFQNYIKNNKVISNKLLLFIHFQLKEMIKILITGIILAIIMLIAFILLFMYPLIIDYNFIKILLWILLLPIILYLFILRKEKRNLYGFIEIIIGAMTITSIIISPTKGTYTGINDVLKIFGGIYIIIRGMDNFEKGLKSPRYIKYWEKIFKKIKE